MAFDEHPTCAVKECGAYLLAAFVFEIVCVWLWMKDVNKVLYHVMLTDMVSINVCLLVCVSMFVLSVLACVRVCLYICMYLGTSWSCV